MKNQLKARDLYSRHEDTRSDTSTVVDFKSIRGMVKALKKSETDRVSQCGSTIRMKDTYEQSKDPKLALKSILDELTKEEAAKLTDVVKNFQL